MPSTPTSFGNRLARAAALALGLSAAAALAVVPNPASDKSGARRNFDLREQQANTATSAASLAHTSAIAALAASVPDLFVDIDGATGATRSLFNRSGYLTGADARPAREIALDFVAKNLTLLGLGSDDFAGYEVTDDVYSAVDGSTHLYLRQRHAGLPVYNAQLQVNVNRDGRILSVNNLFLPALAQAANARTPSLNAAEALDAAAVHLGLGNAGAFQQLAVAPGTQERTRVLAPELSLAPVELALVWLPIREGEARLMWNFVVETVDGEHWYDMNVDAHDGRIWTRIDWIADADYQVYPAPIESPNHAPILPPTDGRTILTDPHNVTASPFGWHDTNGAAGAEFTIMRGNNAHAYQDSDGNDTPPAVQPDCGAGLDCEFAINLAAAPSTYQDASIANLFYWNNFIHDVEFFYGFDSPGGNFQVNTYALGGAGNDDVMAQAQSSGNCNANFGTPADGQRPRMRMFNCTNSTPAHDGDFDAGVVVHEYGHGISNRLVGGPGNVSCMGNPEQPGEGTSDWWGLSLTMRPTDLPTDGRGVGTYLLGQPINGNGVRSQRYSTDPAINTFTYANVNGSSGEHAVGEKWAQAYWEVTWALIAEHGFEPNLFSITHTATDKGNIRAKFYINQGLKNSVCSPGFVDVRNGIIQAATDNYGGEDVCTIWTAFAAYGLGASASQGSSASTTDQVPAFDIPVSCSYLGAAPTTQTVCAGSPAVYNLTAGSAFTPPVALVVTGNPVGTTAVFSVNPIPSVPGGSALTISNTGAVAAGSYPMSVTGNGDVPHALALTLDVVVGVPVAPSLTLPVNSTSVPTVRPTFQWSPITGASGYTLEVDNDSDFSSLTYTSPVAGTSHVPTSDLPLDTHLFWRVRATNACGLGANSAIFNFAVAAPIAFCSTPGVAIPDNAPAGVNTNLVIAATGTIVDLDIQLVATHTFVGDLKFTLSNGGPAVAFYDRPGRTTTGFGCGGDNINVIVNDEGADGNVESQCGNLPATSGNRVGGDPASATLLQAFDGAPLNDTWVLNASDSAGADLGSVVSWCLSVPNAMPFLDGFETSDLIRWSNIVP